MKCEAIVLPEGGTALVCRSQRVITEPRRCEACGAIGATIQCDFPVRRDLPDRRLTTCDRYQCQDCAREIGPNVHYCKAHAYQRPAL